MGYISDSEALITPVEAGTDGIRGVVDVDVTEQIARRFGAATVTAMEGVQMLVVGRDTRPSGSRLSSAVISGAVQRGVSVMDVGVLPTPGVAEVARQFGAAGVVVTASHNPYTDNGLKAFTPNGDKPDETLAQRMQELLNNGIPPTDRSNGHVTDGRTLAKGRYKDFLANSVDLGLLQDLTVVVDAAHGAAYEAAPHVVRRLGGSVIAIASSPNGVNINDGCGATVPSNVANRVVRMGADMGIALDGDADRGLLVSRSGKVLDGDRMMLVNAMAAQNRGQLEPPIVVGTTMSNMGAEEAFTDRGIEFIRAGVGDIQVYREMLRTGAVIGGEQSNHIILRDHARTGDGMLGVLQTMQSLAELGMTLDQAYDLVVDYPQVLVKTRVPQAYKHAIAGHPDVHSAVQNVQAELAERGVRGRVDLRPSGTEPVVRVMAEVAPGHDELAHSAAEHLIQVVDDVASRY